MPPEQATVAATFAGSLRSLTPAAEAESMIRFLIDAFWSVCVYNAAGYFEKNSLDMYSLNSITSKPNAAGLIAI